ncbi:MAG: hypothetical protein ERJ67_00980 [Aphanocapsa feldmannii 277cV]|uniref:Uncharacterized protein n=2 Tax=Aphanocapsa feldmannii TaxID=192050 RepID=A0A524RRY4_9CHRO|nr:MAG: hypothetical protein ERJ69_06810 [Aphanocapsa feldmannii 288cV]TGG96309.1 MAG: hypothetical protein ERJ67_00980 [Aphanocapsa feldmannii 277cV]TGH22110.1 MAG: hypothetical protein ERJ68_04990 [Aphanocapsa feldmannii 277cI]
MDSYSTGPQLRNMPQRQRPEQGDAGDAPHSPVQPYSNLTPWLGLVIALSLLVAPLTSIVLARGPAADPSIPQWIGTFSQPVRAGIRGAQAVQ